MTEATTGMLGVMHSDGDDGNMGGRGGGWPQRTMLIPGCSISFCWSDTYFHFYPPLYIFLSLYIIGEFHNNFSGFDCCKYLILGEFKNQFCAYSAQPEKKCEPGSLFNTKLPASLWFIYCFLVRGTNKHYVNIIDNFYVIVHAKRR